MGEAFKAHSQSPSKFWGKLCQPIWMEDEMECRSYFGSIARHNCTRQDSTCSSLRIRDGVPIVLWVNSESQLNIFQGLTDAAVALNLEGISVVGNVTYTFYRTINKT